MVHLFRGVQHQIVAQVVWYLAFAQGGVVHQRCQQFTYETFGRCVYIAQPKAAAHRGAIRDAADQMDQVRRPDVL